MNLQEQLVAILNEPEAKTLFVDIARSFHTLLVELKKPNADFIMTVSADSVLCEFRDGGTLLASVEVAL